jgi:glycerophosphoryl diester phosphodiesterase
VIDLPRDRTLVVGHRGSAGTAPENTMASFRQAIAAGVDMIEFDVRLTADGHLVVHHDRRLGRTSNGRGEIAALPLKTVTSCDAGSWFSPAFRGETIPSLERVFDEIPKDLPLNVEIKAEGPYRRRALQPEAVLVDLLRRTQRDNILVSSFNHSLLRRLHQMEPSLPIGVLAVPLRDSLTFPSRVARRSGARVFVCSQSRLTRRRADEAHAHNLVVAVYGVQTLKHLDRVRTRGADAVITDFPAIIINGLRGRHP